MAALAPPIDPLHYDGSLHRVPFAVGADFLAKWSSYREDGFTVSLRDGHFLACKIMPGDPIPTERA